MRVPFSEPPNFHSPAKEKRNLNSPCQVRAPMSDGGEVFLPPRARGEVHAVDQLGEKNQSHCAGARRPGACGKTRASALTKKTVWGGTISHFQTPFHQVGISMKLHCIVLCRGQKESPALPLSASSKYGFGRESPRMKRTL
jgi:hypothetical protein